MSYDGGKGKGATSDEDKEVIWTRSHTAFYTSSRMVAYTLSEIEENSKQSKATCCFQRIIWATELRLEARAHLERPILFFFFFFSILARDFGGLDLGDGGSEINF